MKHFKWYTWVGLGLAFFILTITLAKVTIFVKDTVHTEALSVQVKSEKVESDIQMETETKESDSFTSTINIPFTRIDNVDKPLHEWANKQEKDFYDKVGSIEDTFFKKKIDAHFEIESSFNNSIDDIYQIKLQQTQSVNGEEESVNKTIAFNIKNKEILALDDIIDTGKENMQAFATLWTEKAEGKVNKKELMKDLPEMDQLNWMLDKKEEEIVFYFNKGELTEQNEVIKLSFLDIYPYFKDKYASFFITDELEMKIDQMKEEEEQQRQESLQQSKKIAITFDDGPHNTATNQILDALDQYDAKATFFMLSKNVKLYPEIAKDVHDRGHEIANHSVSHANLNVTNEEQQKQEVVQSADIIEEITDVRPTLFRPPYGNYTENVVELAKDSDQSIILWSIDTRDWDNQSANAIYQQVLQKVKPGSIILMHDIHIKTANVVPKILKNLSKDGYEFVTVSELMPDLQDKGVGPYYGE